MWDHGLNHIFRYTKLLNCRRSSQCVSQSIPPSSCSHPFDTSSPGIWAAPVICFQGIEYGHRWMLLHDTGLHKTVMSLFITHSLFLSFTPFLTLRNTPAMLSAALRRGPRGKELREPLANSQGGTEALNPTGTETASHQQSHKWT